MDIKLFFLLLIPAVIILARLLVKQLEARKAKELLDRYDKDNIIMFSSNTNFFGRESEGVKQIRGNGALLLTDKELHYEMWVSDRMIDIPISSIQSVEETTSHLGKTRFTPLLKVVYINEKGNSDSCSWLVGNIKEWKSKLLSLIV